MTPIPPDIDRDNRQIHRLPCRIAVSRVDRSAPLGETRDISLDGLFIATPEALPEGAVVPLAFPVDASGRELLVESEVVRRTAEGMGLRFLKLTKDDRKRLRRYVSELNAVLGHRRQAENLSTLPEPSVEPIREPGTIERLLQQTRSGGIALTVLPADRELRERAVLSAIEEDRIHLRGEKPSQLRSGEKVFVLHTVDFVSYSFPTQVLGSSGAEVALARPALVNYSERRGSSRVRALPGTVVDVPIPWDEGRRVVWPVLETGPGGLSFRADPNQLALMPETPLHGITLRSGEQTSDIEAAVVKHLTLIRPEGASPWLKVGVAHGVRRGATEITHERIVLPNRGLASHVARWWRRGSDVLRWYWHKRFGDFAERADQPFHLVRLPNRRGQDVVGLLDLTHDEELPLRCPLVLVAPGFGSRKESSAMLAATLVDAFRRNHEDIAVLRFDDTNSLGESWKDSGCTDEGRQALHYSISACADDLRGVLDWSRKNRWVQPTDVIVVSVSFASIATRHVLAGPDAPGVSLWVALMGSADAQDAILHVSGHVDIYGNHLRGLKNGVVTLLGCMVDCDRFCADAQKHELATLADAQREMAAIRADVHWLLGRYDAFMDPRRVRDIMSVQAGGRREIQELDCGHVPTSGEIAQAQFRKVAERIWQHVKRRPLPPGVPSLGWLQARSDREWSRVRRVGVSDRALYWRDYLLGEGGLGFDVLTLSPAYRDFVDLQVEEAAPAGLRVLELGAGTGNVSLALAQTGPASLHCADLVPQALERLQGKLAAAGLSAETSVLDVDGGPWTAVRRFLRGDLGDLRCLAGRVPGVTHALVERLTEPEDPSLVAALRGASVDAVALARRLQLPASAAELLADLQLVARVQKGREPETELAHLRRIPSESLKKPRGLPFADGSFDVVVMSLLLSYLEQPDDTLSEALRVLRPGGRLVVSSMRPDTDSSKLFLDLVAWMESADERELPPGVGREPLLRDARDYANRAAELLRLEEEGLFRFFDGEELSERVVRVGFEDPSLRTGFGDPPQAVVLTCRSP
jgi:ubiquinone/menaquinone biosynthesis C-methylase UbiE